VQPQACSVAPVPQCPSAPLQPQACSVAPVQQCPSAPVQQCPSAAVPQCSSAPVPQCPSAPVQQCPSATPGLLCGPSAAGCEDVHVSPCELLLWLQMCLIAAADWLMKPESSTMWLGINAPLALAMYTQPACTHSLWARPWLAVMASYWATCVLLWSATLQTWPCGTGIRFVLLGWPCWSAANHQPVNLAYGQPWIVNASETTERIQAGFNLPAVADACCVELLRLAYTIDLHLDCDRVARFLDGAKALLEEVCTHAYMHINTVCV